jgi:hypothetical protein
MISAHHLCHQHPSKLSSLSQRYDYDNLLCEQKLEVIINNNIAIVFVGGGKMTLHMIYNL